MTNVETKDDRRKALDAFAQPSQDNASLAPRANAMVTTDRVFGAQQVAVHRDEQKVLQKIAALGAAAGDNWFYRYPVKNNRTNQTDWIEGPSIKLANDLARIYGNCQIDTRVFDLGDNWMIYARFTDFESGYELTRPFQQRKSQSSMKTGNERQLDIAFQIGVSKAIRNVVVNALQTYADFAFDAAYDSLVSKVGTDIDKWRTKTVEGIARMPCDLHRVERVIGKPAAGWLAPDIARVIAMMKAIADGMASIDETFPTADAQKEDAKPTEQPSESQGATPGHPGPATDGEPAATEANSPPGKAGVAAGEMQPESEIQYSAFAAAWIAKLTDPKSGEARWKNEDALREHCGVSEETDDELETKLRAKCKALRSNK